jgi:hypothetical protein
MTTETVYSDFLISLTGSAVFWTTVAGIMIRTLKLDRDKLEEFFKRSYNAADGFTFSAVSISRFTTDWMVRSLYRGSNTRVAMVTFITCIIINSVAFIGHWIYWEQNKTNIQATLALVARQANPNYYNIISDEHGRNLASKALDLDDLGGYNYHDAVSLSIQAEFTTFRSRYKKAIESKKLSYVDSINSIFATDYSGGGYISAGPISGLILILMLFSVQVVFSLGVDIAAVHATLSSYRAAVEENNYFRAAWFFITTVILFLCSFVGYKGILAGRPLDTVIIPGTVLDIILFPIALVFALLAVILLIGTIFDADREFLLSRLYGGAALLATCAGFVVFVDNPFIIFEMLKSDWRLIFSELSESHVSWSLVLSMPAIYLAIFLVSTWIWVALFRTLFIILKEYVLGQVYGASVLSGSTFLFGFLTTIITSTAFAWSLMAFFRP